MFNFKTFKQKSPQQRFLFILGLAMFAVYLTLGIILILWKDIPVTLDRMYRVLLGCLLIVYGGFRFIRLMKQDED